MTTNNTPPGATSQSVSNVTNSLAAGYAAGICGVLVGHPLDSVKVLLQTGGGKSMASAAQPSPASAASTVANVAANGSAGNASLTRAATATVAPSAAQVAGFANMSTGAAASASASLRSGPPPTRPSSRSVRALYAGVTGPLASVGLIQSANFGLYDAFRRSLHRRQNPSAPASDYLYGDSIQNVALASLGAGGLISLLTSPLQVVKTKQQIMVWTFRRALADTYCGGGLSGIRNFFTGFAPHLYCDSVGRMVYFTSYEIFKRTLAQYKVDMEEQPGGRRDDLRETFTCGPGVITLPERMACAALSGMICWSVIFPFDAVRCRMYADSLSGTSVRMGVWETIKNGYSERKSIRPFFRGFGVTVFRAGPVAAAVMPIYDLTLEWLTTH